MRGSTTSKGRHNLGTDTSGAHLLPDRSNLHRSQCGEPGNAPERETVYSHGVAFRGKWWQNLPEGIGAHRARRNERADRARMALEIEHLTGHPDIPVDLIRALQRGTDPEGTPSRTVVTIDGQRVHVAISVRGTGIPEPDSRGVWDGITGTYREISDSPYCADVVRPLPQEIAAIGWTNSADQTVNVTACKPPRLRRLLGVALFPLARAGDFMAMSAAGSAAVLALGTGSVATVPITEEAVPELRPKTGIAQQIPQAATTLRPEPVKVRVRVHPPVPARPKTTTRSSAPRPATIPATTRAEVSTPPTPHPSVSPVPANRPEPVPAASESAPPVIPARPIDTGLETLLPGLTSLLRPSPIER